MVTRISIGKPFEHEAMGIVKFDLDGKICYLKAFYDTKHVEEHAQDAGTDGAQAQTTSAAA